MKGGLGQLSPPPRPHTRGARRLPRATPALDCDLVDADCAFVLFAALQAETRAGAHVCFCVEEPDQIGQAGGDVRRGYEGNPNISMISCENGICMGKAPSSTSMVLALAAASGTHPLCIISRTQSARRVKRGISARIR